MKVRGFTLIELMMVVAILAILAAVSFSIYRHYFHSAFEVDPIQVLLSAKLAEEEYYADHGQYACRIEDLPGFNDGNPDNKYWLNNDADGRRKFYIEVDNGSCNETFYSLHVKNDTNDPDWEIEWTLNCTANANIGECQPVQNKGSSTFQRLF
ncbi:prepilin-type N-terminal cleavage/methylation domain-containing protein [Thermosulfurimonas sp.]|uniref:type IV pilin protein n=1 Tax=Thermosulfurimonas sp. TaxID=2080236 RepID=UPI0025FD21D6|nr:prepilin-type N-terminal cleavage/methylation domain-containing protein [Thermosulfurimonas sp.]